MKQLRIFSLLLSLVGMVFVSSCMKDEDEPIPMDAKDVKPELLIGKWKNDQSEEYKRYTTTVVNPPIENDYDKEGFMWNLAEDVQEGDDGTKFYYYIDGNQIKEARPNVSTYIYRIYTLTVLTSTKLEYFYGNTTYSYTKVN